MAGVESVGKSSTLQCNDGDARFALGILETPLLRLAVDDDRCHRTAGTSDPA